MMRYELGDWTVGDIGATIEIPTDETLTGKNIDIVFIKPSGASWIVNATISGDDDEEASYTTVSGDVDESGDWRAHVRNVTDGYDFKGYIPIRVNPKPEDMAKAR